MERPVWWREPKVDPESSSLFFQVLVGSCENYFPKASRQRAAFSLQVEHFLRFFYTNAIEKHVLPHHGFWPSLTDTTEAQLNFSCHLQDAPRQPWIPLTQLFCCLVFLGLIFGVPCDGVRETSGFAYRILMCKCPLNLLASGWKVYFTRGDQRRLSIRSGERNPTEALTPIPGPPL